jgi:hypothetical protein
VKCAHDGEGGQRHHLLMQLGEALHMGLAIVSVERLDLFGPVLFDVRRTSPALQTPPLPGMIGLDLGQRRKLGFDGPLDPFWIEQDGWRRPAWASTVPGHEGSP